MSAAFLTELEKLELECGEAAEKLQQEAKAAGKTTDDISRVLFEEMLTNTIPNMRAKLIP